MLLFLPIMLCCSALKITYYVEEQELWSELYYAISLGALVPNSRDRHEKQWRPDFTHHKTHPKMRFV